MAARTSKRVLTKPVSEVVLSSILRYDNPGQWTVPDSLSLGTDGKLYLKRSGDAESAKAKAQPITLKESVAWFRVGNQYSLKVAQGDRFDDWLKLIEQALS